MTEVHLKTCDEIFAVDRIGRAETNDGISRVFDYAKEADLANIGIICTASDVGDATEYSFRTCLILFTGS